VNVATLEAPSAIGAPFAGGIHAGLSIHDNEPVHLVLLPGEFTGTWTEALAWANKLDAELPTRMDLLAMWNNVRGEFEKYWYWSCEQSASYPDYAWYQYFGFGYQDFYPKTSGMRARAVRRLAI